jgi:hypothetical protein
VSLRLARKVGKVDIRVRGPRGVCLERSDLMSCRTEVSPETSDVISWQRVFSLHKMRERVSDNPDNQQGGHKILVIFDGNNYIFFA